MALCADDVNINLVQYSLCPIVLALLNLLHHLHYQFSNLIFVGIIPGPKEPEYLYKCSSYYERNESLMQVMFNIKVEILLRIGLIGNWIAISHSEI